MLKTHLGLFTSLIWVSLFAGCGGGDAGRGQQLNQLPVNTTGNGSTLTPNGAVDTSGTNGTVPSGGTGTDGNGGTNTGGQTGTGSPGNPTGQPTTPSYPINLNAGITAYSGGTDFNGPDHTAIRLASTCSKGKYCWEDAPVSGNRNFSVPMPTLYQNVPHLSTNVLCNVMSLDGAIKSQNCPIKFVARSQNSSSLQFNFKGKDSTNHKAGTTNFILEDAFGPFRRASANRVQLIIQARYRDHNGHLLQQLDLAYLILQLD